MRSYESLSYTIISLLVFGIIGLIGGWHYSEPGPTRWRDVITAGITFSVGATVALALAEAWDLKCGEYCGNEYR